MNIYQLNRKKKKKLQLRMNIFNTILKKCYKRINIASENHSSCFFKVPSFLIGEPLFNLKECCKYVLDKLRDKGFKLVFFEPDIIYINWEEIPTKEEIKTQKIIKYEQKNKFRLISDVPTENLIYNIEEYNTNFKKIL